MSKTRSTGFFMWSLLIVVATCVSYWPALGAGFIWDDPDYVVNNFMLRSGDGLVQIWTNPRSVPQWYPMVFTSFWIEYQLFGLWPVVYHTTNIVLHAITAILVWQLLARLKVPGALLAGFVFALHPVHVESVAWITERKNTLSGLFYFASMMAYLSWAGVFNNDTSPRKINWKYGLAVALFLGAVFSKTVAGSLPAAILLVLYYVQGKLTWRDVMPVLPMFAIAMVLGLTTAYLERIQVGAYGPEWDYAPTLAGEFAHRSIIAGKALWFYAHTIVWPTDLAFIYPRWQIDRTNMLSYLWIIAAMGVVMVAWSMRNRWGRGPLVCVLYFGGTLFPALGYFNVFPHRYSFVADHFQHLASTGLVVLICAVLATRLGTWRYSMHAGVGLCVLLGLLTMRQSTIYDNVEALWADTLRKNPDSWMAHSNMGQVMVNREVPDLGRAEDHFRRALELFENEETLTSLATILAQRGNVEFATVYAQLAIDRNPKFLLSRNLMGQIKLGQGDIPGASAEFLAAFELNERDVQANLGLGRVYRQLSNSDLAVEHLRIAATWSPEDASIRTELAQALMEFAAASGQRQLLSEAIFNLQTAVRLKPTVSSNWVLLGVAYFDAGDKSSSIAALKRAIELDPSNEQVREVLRRVGG
jgi:protein O-mannosyl-transferase